MKTIEKYRLLKNFLMARANENVMKKISLYVLSFIVLMLIPIKVEAILGIIVALLGIIYLIKEYRWIRK